MSKENFHIIDEEMFLQLEEMLLSEDFQTKSLAMEIIKQADYNDLSTMFYIKYLYPCFSNYQDPHIFQSYFNELRDHPQYFDSKRPEIPSGSLLEKKVNLLISSYVEDDNK